MPGARKQDVSLSPVQQRRERTTWRPVASRNVKSTVNESDTPSAMPKTLPWSAHVQGPRPSWLRDCMAKAPVMPAASPSKLLPRRSSSAAGAIGSHAHSRAASDTSGISSYPGSGAGRLPTSRVAMSKGGLHRCMRRRRLRIARHRFSPSSSDRPRSTGTVPKDPIPVEASSAAAGEAGSDSSTPTRYGG